MKKTFTFLISSTLLLIMLIMTACGESSPREEFLPSGAGANDQVSNLSIKGDYHKVYGQNKNKVLVQNFEHHVKRFWSFGLQPKEIGSISSLKNNMLEGVFFKVKIELDEETQDIQDFSLFVQLRDSLVGTVNPATKKPYEPYELVMLKENDARLLLTGDHLVNEEGIPASGSLQMEFRDYQTALQFIGTVKGGLFSGEIRFRNHIHYMNLFGGNQRGEEGVLGFFQAPVCQLFTCKE